MGQKNVGISLLLFYPLHDKGDTYGANVRCKLLSVKGITIISLYIIILRFILIPQLKEPVLYIKCSYLTINMESFY